MNIDSIRSRDIACAVVVLLVISRFLRHILFRGRRGFLRYPPGPKGWPVLGALPLLGDKPHEALAKMAKRYGPLMYMKMGVHDMVVASTPASARALLKTHDAVFSNRPPTATARNTYNGEDMVFADYGPRWKLLRTLSSLHMLGGRAVKDHASVREQEVRHMLRAMQEMSGRGEPVHVPEMLSCAIANILGQLVLSRRVFETNGLESSKFKEMVARGLEVSGRFNIGDFIPYIAWMDIQGIDRKSKAVLKEFDLLLDEMIEQHETTTHDRAGKPDFLDLLMAYRENPANETLDLINIKGLLMDLFFAGTDTSSSTIEWALAELLKNRNILDRAHEEMDRVIGRHRHLRESDLPSLPYLRAICKEALRKHPATPLIPRISTSDCQENGYDIPRGTRLIVNVWAIGRDPEVWDSPLEFVPERFLNGESGNDDFEMIPFGTGRRICAGMKLATVLVEYLLGTLVHAFEWHLPGGGADELNMDESFGLTLQKAVPLSALITPRLSPSAI